LLDLVSKNSLEINFLIIYIKEAHASDQWPLGTTFNVPQHKTIDQRIDAANSWKNILIENQLKNFNNVIILVDDIDNSFTNTYSAWPERGMIVMNNVIEYYSSSGLDAIVTWENDIEEWLQDWNDSLVQ